jgi:hypothetical protein
MPNRESLAQMAPPHKPDGVAAASLPRGDSFSGQQPKGIQDENTWNL